MNNNKLIEYKENVFTKISIFFKKLFFRKKETHAEFIDEAPIYNNPKENFIENIAIKENEEEKRLKILQLQYDNGEIDEDDISEEDIDKLIALYKKETEELNKDTLKRKIRIEKMLKEMKKS